MAAVDRNTGAPVSPYGNQQSFDQIQVTGPSTTNTTGTSSSRTQGTQATVSSQYALNTTPAARDALNSLIETLQDRPVISQQEAVAKFPQATVSYSPSGWIYRNPVTGLTMSPQEAKLFNQQQAFKQQEYVQSGGMVAGGTIEQKALAAERQTEIERNRITQEKYTKEAAIADAKGLTDYFTRVLTEQQLPGILRGAEGSGASQGTTRALLTQQAIARNAESAAKTGLEASVAYGGINTNLANVLEELTKNDPNSVANQLINALNVAKGIETSGTTSQVSQTNQTTQGEQNQVSVNQGNTTTLSKQIQPTQPAPVTQALNVPTSPAYTPSSNAGTGYIVANAPVAAPDPEFISYGGGDTNVLFED